MEREGEGSPPEELGRQGSGERELLFSSSRSWRWFTWDEGGKKRLSHPWFVDARRTNVGLLALRKRKSRRAARAENSATLPSYVCMYICMGVTVSELVPTALADSNLIARPWALYFFLQSMYQQCPSASGLSRSILELDRLASIQVQARNLVRRHPQRMSFTNKKWTDMDIDMGNGRRGG